MSFVSDLLGTGKLILTLEDRIAAISRRVERLEDAEASMRDRMIRIETMVDLMLYGGRRRIDRD